MHAVLLTTTIDSERAGEAQSLLATDVVPRVKEAQGSSPRTGCGLTTESTGHP
jgi:hypothetical protein